MKLIVCLATVTIGISIAQPGVAATTREVYNIAKSVAARIDVSQDGESIGRGSGFLLKKRGSVYTLITSKHVTKCPENSCTYTITTADGRSYPAIGKQVSVSSDLDLAAIEFTSPHNYPLARLGDSTAVKPGDIIYTSGFPVEAAGFTFAGGEVLVNAQRRLDGDRGGYSLVYNAYTNKGMSGGAVFDRQGRVVAIHGHGDRVTVGTIWNDPSDRTTRSTPTNTDNYDNKMGFNRGVSTRWLLTSNLMGQSAKIGITSPQSADDFLILGMNKFIAPDSNNIKQDKQQALAYFDRSIQLQPNYAMSYFLRSLVNIQLGDRADTSSSDLTKTYQLNSALPIPSPYNRKPIPVDRLDRWLDDHRNFILANRLGMEAAAEFRQVQSIGRRRRQQPELGATYQSSLQKLDRAIQLYPQDSPDYYIKLNRANLYVLRGELLKQDPSSAAASMADFKKAGEIYPVAEYAYSYFQRGYWRAAGGDRSGAMADYRRSAALAQTEGDPNILQMANAMLNPGSSGRKSGAGFIPGGVSPVRRRHQISTRSPQLSNTTQAGVYVRMANRIANKNQDLKLAIRYLQRAAELYKQDGNTTKYQETIDTIRRYTGNDPDL
jgi:tetratricopeptide (TPR) repeat protein